MQDGVEFTDWTRMEVSAVAPLGAVSATVFLLHIQTADPCCNSGPLYWDDVSLEVIPIAAAIWLFGFGLLVLIRVARRKQTI